MAKLIIFGCGHTGLAIAKLWDGDVIGTTRKRHDELKDAGITAYSLDQIAELKNHIESADAIVISTPPPDPVFEIFADAIAASKAWLGYLSTTAVYGNRDGREVDESTIPAPTSKRGKLRLQAEQEWQSLCPHINIYRLAGIYGNGRGPIEKIRSGRARKIFKEGQVFGRIHVDDIARIVMQSCLQNDNREIYNLTDNLTVPPQEVLDYAADLLGVARLPETPFEQASMTPMARSFYSENKRVLNTKIREAFGPLLYPDYKHGLKTTQTKMSWLCKCSTVLKKIFKL